MSLCIVIQNTCQYARISNKHYIAEDYDKIYHPQR